VTKDGYDSALPGHLGVTELGFAPSWVSAGHGPNKNWHYTSAPLIVGQNVVYYTRDLERGSEFYHAQHAQAPEEPAPAAYTRYCEGSDLDEFLCQQVLTQEGALAGRALDHHIANVNYFRTPTAQRANEALTLYVEPGTHVQSILATQHAPRDEKLIAPWRHYQLTTVDLDRTTAQITMPQRNMHYPPLHYPRGY